MRIFSIIILVISAVADSIIALPYLFLSFGSGLVVDAARAITFSHLLSALLQLIAVVLLVMNKQGKLLLIIGMTLIGIVIFKYTYQPNAGKNIIPIASAISIFGSVFYSYIARINKGYPHADIRKVQRIYAVIPTVLLILSSLGIPSVIGSYNKYMMNNRIDNAYEEMQKDKQAKRATDEITYHPQSTLGYIIGDTHTLQIKDGLTTYNRDKHVLKLYLFPTVIDSTEKQRVIKMGYTYLQHYKKSPDVKKWSRYPHAIVTLHLYKTGEFNINNIESISIFRVSIDEDKPSGNTSISNAERWVTTFTTEYKNDHKRLIIHINDDQSPSGFHIEINDIIRQLPHT